MQIFIAATDSGVPTDAAKIALTARCEATRYVVKLGKKDCAPSAQNWTHLSDGFRSARFQRPRRGVKYGEHAQRFDRVCPG